MRVATLLTLFVVPIRASIRLECDTTVEVSGGKLEIELWPGTAPKGVKRILDLAESGFFVNLPFYQAMESWRVMFGIQPNADKQRMWDQQGDIADDAPPAASIPTTEGLVCFSGDPHKGANSRSTLMFMTLGTTHLQWHRNRPWEVPVGRVVKGLDVLRGIYTGYSDEPQLRFLDPTNTKRPGGVPDAATYLKQFDKMDKFHQCRVVRDDAPSSDPAGSGKFEL